MQSKLTYTKMTQINTYILLHGAPYKSNISSWQPPRYCSELIFLQMETGCQFVPKMFSVTFLSGFCPQTIILDLHKNKKSEVDSHIFRTEFLEIKSAYKHYMSIYTDGSKQDIRLHVVLLVQILRTVLDYLTIVLFLPLKPRLLILHFIIIRDQPEKQFIIYSDSLSVLCSLKNLDHRNPLIQQVLRKFNYLSSFKEIVFCWLPSHTNIRGNELADLEAKSALSLSITNLKIPHSDFKSNIHQYVMNKCQSVWEEQTGNKLHELKPDFNSKCSFLGYSRQNQTKITRCRIGHTRLTHAYYSPTSSLLCVYPVMNLSPLSIFSLLALNLIISAINIIPQKLSKNFLVIHLLTKSSIFLKKPTFLTSCN